MSGLLGFLLRQSVEIIIGQALVRAATRRLKGALLFYAAVAVFAVAALAFFFVLVDRWVAQLVGGIGAAAILFGVNVLAIALMVAVRSILKAREPALPASPLAALIKTQSESLGASRGNFEAGLAIGRQIRKAAPQIAIGAAVLGLLFGLTRRRGPRPDTK